MSDVSRNDSSRSTPTGPVAPPRLTALLSELRGPRDFWDRPEGDWAHGLAASGADRAEELRHANSCYRLGTKALRRGDLQRAENWLRRACFNRHPGAAFRLVVVLHGKATAAGAGAALSEEIAKAVRSAALWGHGDARYLLKQEGWRLPYGHLALGRCTKTFEEDPEFAPAVREVLAALWPSAAALPLARPVLPARIPMPRPSGFRAGGPVPGCSRRWSPAALRTAALTDIVQQMPQETRPPRRWQSVLRVLDVLDILSSADQSVSAEKIARTTSLPHRVLQRLLLWLCEQGMARRLPDGSYAAGPVLLLLHKQQPQQSTRVLQQALGALRDAAGAAVYVSSYTGGEVTISQYADGPTTPKVNEWVDFRAAAHASAVGKSLLAQLDFEGRMDHLSRRGTARLTSRTITDPKALFHALDAHGPQAAQFDLLEYSTHELCVAVPLGFAGQAGCVALSLPVGQQHRLTEAARILSSRSTALLLSLLLAADPPERTPPRPRPADHDAAQSSPQPTSGQTPLAGQSGRPVVPPGRDTALGLVFPGPGTLQPPPLGSPAPRARHLVSSGP